MLIKKPSEHHKEYFKRWVASKDVELGTTRRESFTRYDNKKKQVNNIQRAEEQKTEDDSTLVIYWRKEKKVVLLRRRKKKKEAGVQY